MSVHRQHSPTTAKARVTRFRPPGSGHAESPAANDNVRLDDDFLIEQPDGISPLMLIPVAGLVICAMALFLLF